MTTTRTLMQAALAVLCLASPLQAAACGSGFVLGDEVGAAHPASIGVAFAMLDARSTGMLSPTAEPDGTDARVSADDAAHKLEQRLASVRTSLPAMSLLLVESRLWTRYAAPRGRPGGAVDPHAGHAAHESGPANGDVVLITGEAVLRGLLAGRISWGQAVDSGLVVLAGDPVKRMRVAALLASRFAPSGAAMAGRASPVRF